MMVLTVNILISFITFFVTAMIYHYETTATFVAVGIGCLAYLVKIRIRVSDQLLKAKLLIHSVIDEEHSKFEDIDEKGEHYKQKIQDLADNVYIPEMIYVWRQMKTPCIPKQLYEDCMKKICPVARVRVRLLIKVILLGIFVAFITRAMIIVGMVEKDSGDNISSIELILTLVASTVPSFLESFEYAHESDVRELKKKEIIKLYIGFFLDDYPFFNNYKDIYKALKVDLGLADDDDKGICTKQKHSCVEQVQDGLQGGLHGGLLSGEE